MKKTKLVYRELSCGRTGRRRCRLCWWVSAVHYYWRRSVKQHQVPVNLDSPRHWRPQA